MNGLFRNFVSNKSIYVKMCGVIDKILFVVCVLGDVLDYFRFGIVIL